MRDILHLTTTICICIASSVCYSQENGKLANDDLRLYDQVPIFYDFKPSPPDTNKLRSLLPFDKLFSIRMINIPDEVKAIMLKIYIINNHTYSYKNYKNSPREIDLSYILSLPENRILKSDSLVRDRNFMGSSATATFSKLKPNQDYVFQVTTYLSRELTDNEATELSTKLKSDKELLAFVDLAAKSYINDPQFGLTGISNLVPALNSVASTAVKKIDESYVMHKPNFDLQVRALANLYEAIANSVRTINESAELIKKNDLNVFNNSQKQNFQVVRQKLTAINWNQVAINDKAYKALSTAFEKVLSDNTDEDLKADLEAHREIFQSEIDKFIRSKDKTFETFIDEVIVTNAYSETSLAATYSQDFVKQARMYITFDAGLAYVFKLDRGNFYTGLNIYFRPLDKSIPLNQYRTWDEFILSRTSLLLGFSVTSVQQDSVRKGFLDDNKALIVGAGFRVLPWLKFNGGTYLYYKFSPNPLASQTKVRFTGAPFLSLSIDIDAKVLLQGIGEAIFKQ